MAIKIRDLIKKLAEKDPNDEVEFIVATTNGDMVCMDVEMAAHEMAELLSLFSRDGVDTSGVTLVETKK